MVKYRAPLATPLLLILLSGACGNGWSVGKHRPSAAAAEPRGKRPQTGTVGQIHLKHQATTLAPLVESSRDETTSVSSGNAFDHLNNSSCSTRGRPGWTQDSWASSSFLNALAYVIVTPFLLCQAYKRRYLYSENRKILENMNVAGSVLRIGVIYALLVLSFTLRILWLVLDEANVCTNKARDMETRSLICPCFMVLRTANRLSLLFFFSAFSVIAIFWSEVLAQAKHRQTMAAGSGLKLMESSDLYTDFDSEESEAVSSPEDGITSQAAHYDGDSSKPARNCCSPQTFFTLVNVWVYMIEIVVLCLTAFGHMEDETYAKIRQVNYIAVASFFSILSIAMVFVGQSVRKLSMKFDVALACKTTVVMITCALCFTLRSVILIWEPVTGHRIPDDIWSILHPTFVYAVPEITPVLVLLWTMAPGSKPASDDSETQPPDVRGSESWIDRALISSEYGSSSVNSMNIGPENKSDNREWF